MTVPLLIEKQSISVYLQTAIVCFLMVSATARAEDAKPIKIACVGDSITKGHGLKRTSFPKMLQKRLGSNYVVGNFGTNGLAVQKKTKRPIWKGATFKKVEAFAPQVIVLKLGTNDACQDNGNWKGKAAFKSDYLALIEVLLAIKSKPKLFLCLPVPSFPGDPGKRWKVLSSDILPAIKEVAKEKGLPLIDTYTPLVNKEKLFPDKVHPNAEGAGIIADTVYRRLEEVGVKTSNKPPAPPAKS